MCIATREMATVWRKSQPFRVTNQACGSHNPRYELSEKFSVDNQSLLSDDELAFIRQLNADAHDVPVDDVARLDIGENLGDLLKRLERHEQLSISTEVDNKHLTYPLHLVKDGDVPVRLELGTPIITEAGAIERPARVSVPRAKAVCAQNLQILEISSNGMVVRTSSADVPSTSLDLNLPLLEDERPLHLKATLVRRIDQQHFAYYLEPQQSRDELQLRRYIFEQHQLMSA